MPFAKIHGRSLHYTDHASQNESATSPLTLILVHGLGSTSSFYYPILPYLSQHRVITFDNYGAGRSKLDPSISKETSIAQIADDVEGLLDHLSVQKAIVVGYSMGGMVPTVFASKASRKQKIASGICIGPVHPSEAVAKVFDGRIKTVNEQGIESMANTIPSAATAPGTDALKRSFIREMIMAQDPEGYIANCKAIANAPAPDYASVECPILIIAGEVDKSAPVSGCEYIRDQLINVKDKKMEVMKCGHWYCVEDPELTGKLVAEWCKKFA